MKNIRSAATLLLVAILFSGATFAGKDTTIVIKTSAQCGDCKKRIEHDLSFEKGVKKVTLDLKTKAVTVIYDNRKTSAEAIRVAVTKIGYDADAVPADGKAYGKLPTCCKKPG